MAFHPPMLYLGYVGFSVPFAFAIAALVTGRVGEGWLLDDPALDAVRLGLPHRSASCSARGGATRCSAGAAYWALGPGGERQPPALAHRRPPSSTRCWCRSAGGCCGSGTCRCCAPRSALTILGTFLTRSGVLDERARLHRVGRIGAVPAGLLRPHRGRDRRRSSAGGATACARRGRSTRRSRARARSSPTTCSSSLFAFVVLLGTVFPLIVEALQDRRHRPSGRRSSTA